MKSLTTVVLMAVATWAGMGAGWAAPPKCAYTEPLQAAYRHVLLGIPGSDAELSQAAWRAAEACVEDPAALDEQPRGRYGVIVVLLSYLTGNNSFHVMEPKEAGRLTSALVARRTAPRPAGS